MKHSICGFNHAALILNFKLNYDDAQLIRCIIDFRDTGKMDTVNVDGKQYFWVCYSWILDELPGLQCSNKRTLARWMDKYVDNGLMEKHVLSGNRTYYRFIPVALNNLQSYPVLQSATPVSKIATPVLQSTTPCTPEYNPPVLQSTTIDPSSINPSTKDQYIPGSSPEPQNQEGGTVTNLPLSDHTNSNANTRPKKEESPGKEERKLTDAEILFQHWISFKNMVQHKELTARVRDKIKVALKEDPLESLKAAVENYSKVLAAPKGVYFYTYRNDFEDFFRAGVNKAPPYKKFLPEMDPLENLRLKQNFRAQNSQQGQEQAETSSRVDQERFTEYRALNRLSEAVRRFKKQQGEDPKKWVDFFCFARPADRDNAFLRWIWDMAIKGVPFTEEIFNQIHNRICAESGLTYDTFEASRDAIFNRTASSSSQQRA